MGPSGQREREGERGAGEDDANRPIKIGRWPKGEGGAARGERAGETGRAEENSNGPREIRPKG